jgi:signal transduction histidine kinase
VLRHAGARTAWLEVCYEPSRVVIGVRDDGSGAGRVGGAGGNGRQGHGISGMRERALALSGQFTAGPHPDGGFQVRARLPLDGAGGGQQGSGSCWPTTCWPRSGS